MENIYQCSLILSLRIWHQGRQIQVVLSRHEDHRDALHYSKLLLDPRMSALPGSDQKQATLSQNWPPGKLSNYDAHRVYIYNIYIYILVDQYSFILEWPFVAEKRYLSRIFRDLIAKHGPTTMSS